MPPHRDITVSLEAPHAVASGEEFEVTVSLNTPDPGALPPNPGWKVDVSFVCQRAIIQEPTLVGTKGHQGRAQVTLERASGSAFKLKAVAPRFDADPACSLHASVSTYNETPLPCSYVAHRNIAGR